jgi:hypothetical protein
MNKKPTYEESVEEQFNELPLPDEEQSWQKMKQLLEDDDDRRRVLPPFSLSSCTGWGLLFIAVMVAAWLLLHKKKEGTVAQQPGPVEQKVPVYKRENQAVGKGRIPYPVEGHPAGSAVPGEAGSVQGKEQPRLVNKLPAEAPVPGAAPLATTKKMPTGKSSHAKGKTTIQSNEPAMAGGVIGPPKNGVRYFIPVPAGYGSRLITDAVTRVQPGTVKAIVKADGPRIDQTSIAGAGKTKKKQLWWSAGLGVHQQIPVGGQSATAYTYAGNKNTLLDYIPSVYVRLHRGEKWFIQGEFQYGTPQSVNDFSFSQQTKYDTAATMVTTTTDQLEKTYYHQLLLNFNYYVQPNWSIGLGGAYSRFHGAVTEEEARATNVQTGVQTIARQIKPVEGFKDSFLYKTQVHLLLQTEYEWKRFSFGLRYLKDLQPYIKYTKPDGDINTKKNQALEFVVRYRLWQSPHPASPGKGR